MDLNHMKTPEDVEKMKAEIEQRIRERGKQEQEQKVKNYRTLNCYAKKGGTLFTGSSLMEQFPVCELCADLGMTVYNRGIGGTTTDDFLREIDTVLFDLEPSKVFLNIGTNDMNPREDGEDWMEHLLNNYGEILRRTKEKLPEAKVYCMAYYPVNPEKDKNPMAQGMLRVRTRENLNLVNGKITRLAVRYGYEFIDVNEGLTDERGYLKEDYTIEGVHMFAEAYCVVFENLKKYL